MARGLDHVVHAVRDLDAAAGLYRRLGFTVGARNRHPWGTHNQLVQLPGFFVEILTLAEPDKLGSDGFSVLFGRFNGDFIARHEGLSLAILESTDAAADAAAFAAAGIAASATPLTFERRGERPDGTAVTVGFSLAFARDAGAPDIGFATCRQHHPQNFWNPALQAHANGATGIAGLVMVADNPSDHHVFLSAFVGERDLHATSTGVTARTPRGELQIMDRVAFRDHFGTAAPDGTRLAALRFAVADLDRAAAQLRQAGLAFHERIGRVVVGPEAGSGATLVFEPAA